MLASLIALIPLLATPDLPVRAGAPINFDGRVEKEEWKEAFVLTRPLRDGKEISVRVKRTGHWLALSIEANRAFAGELTRLHIADEEGSWLTSLVLGAGVPQFPTALWRRGPPSVVARRGAECPRGCLARASVASPDGWSVEYLIRFAELGIGLGDQRKLRVLISVANGGEGELLVFPAEAKGYDRPASFATLSSDDRWGASEPPVPPDPGHSREYDDQELLFRLYREHDQYARHVEPDLAVIASATRPRSNARIATLAKKIEDARVRNPTLTAWSYFLGRLYQQGNLFDQAREVIDSVPMPVRRLDAFVFLEAQHYMDAEQPEKSLEVCARNPLAAGVDSVMRQDEQLKTAIQEETLAREADARKPEKNPRIHLKTAKGVVECELYEDDAPNAVRNFVDLVLREKFYDKLKFHDASGGIGVRVGDPRSRVGSTARIDGPEWKLMRDEGKRRFLRGSLAMVPAGGGVLHGSQFVIAVVQQLTDEKKMMVFGRVVSGMEVIDSLEQDDWLESVEVIERRNHVYDPRTARIR